MKPVLGDNPDPASNQDAEMKLNIRSTGAQACFAPSGPGRAEPLATRLRTATKKALSRERRDFLMKKIGAVTEEYEIIPKKKLLG